MHPGLLPLMTRLVPSVLTEQLARKDRIVLLALPVVVLFVPLALTVPALSHWSNAKCQHCLPRPARQFELQYHAMSAMAPVLRARQEMVWPAPADLQTLWFAGPFHRPLNPPCAK